MIKTYGIEITAYGEEFDGDVSTLLERIKPLIRK